MQLPESRLWSTMSARLTPDFWAIRVENLLGSGMADVWLASYLTRDSGWVELKAPRTPKREASRIVGASHPLMVDQENFHLKCARTGIPSWILIRDYPNHGLFLVPGGRCSEVNEANRKQLNALSLLPCDTARWECVCDELRKFEVYEN